MALTGQPLCWHCSFRLCSARNGVEPFLLTGPLLYAPPLLLSPVPLQAARQREKEEVVKYKIMLRRNQLAFWAKGRPALVSVLVCVVCTC